MLTAITRFFQIITTTTSNFFFGHPVEYRAPSPRIGGKRTFEEAFGETAGDVAEQVRKRQKTTNDVEFEDVVFKTEEEEEEITFKLEEKEVVEFKVEGEEFEDIWEGVELKIEEEEVDEVVFKTEEDD